MYLKEVEKLSNNEKKQVLVLWNNEYPKSLNHHTISDFEEYLRSLQNQSHVLVLNEQNQIKGWYFDFTRDNERWFAIILDSNLQGNGYGCKILSHAKAKEDVLNGWVIDKNKTKKVNGEMYQSPLQFYLKNEFELFSDIRLELDTISAVKIKWIKAFQN